MHVGPYPGIQYRVPFSNFMPPKVNMLSLLASIEDCVVVRMVTNIVKNTEKSLPNCLKLIKRAIDY